MPAISRERSPRSRWNSRRRVVVTVTAFAAAAMLATPAAAQPDHRACLGEDVRVYARGGSSFGAFVSTVLADEGAGMEIRAHLSGLIPDSTIPNTCND